GVLCLNRPRRKNSRKRRKRASTIARRIRRMRIGTRSRGRRKPATFSTSMPRLNRRLGVFVVGDVFQPDDVAAVLVCFLYGQVSHGSSGRGSVPMAFLRRDGSGITGTIDLWGLSGGLHQAWAI